MNSQCTSVGRVSSSLVYQLVPWSDSCLTNSSCGSCARISQASLEYLHSIAQKQNHGSRRVCASRTSSRQGFAGFVLDGPIFTRRRVLLSYEEPCSVVKGVSLSTTTLRGRISHVFKLRSAEGAERSTSEDPSVGSNKVELPLQSFDRKESIKDFQAKTPETVGKFGESLLGNLSTSGGLTGDQREFGGKARPAKLRSPSVNYEEDSESPRRAYNDEASCEENSRDKYRLDQRPGFEESNYESEQSGYDASDNEASETRPGEGMDDFGLENLLDETEEVEYVTRIIVPRQRYIRVPKSELLSALLMFPGQHPKKISTFCSYLELVLHANHKFLLEELRADYLATHSTTDGGSLDLRMGNSTKGANTAKKTTSWTRRSGVKSDGTDGEQLHPSHCDLPPDTKVLNDPPEVDNRFPEGTVGKGWGSKIIDAFKQRKDTGPESEGDTFLGNHWSKDEETRTSSAIRFQKNFLKLLKSAQFEGLSAQDLELTAALNSDYLLTLPVAVDWKRASKSNAIIYRRGYAKEQQKGFLLGAKFDYLQSTILREVFKGLTGPLLITGHWFMKTWKSLRNDPEGRFLAESLERWVEEPLPLDGENTSEGPTQAEYETDESDTDMPIWKAAQQALPRYEAVLSSVGSRGLLLRRILVRMGLLPSDSISPPVADEDPTAVEPHLRPNFLLRVSMKDIWLPASKTVVGKNVWKRLCSAFSVFFSRVTLQEPAFQELVLLYTDDGLQQSEPSDLQLKMYKTIPLPDLKIVFPSKRLSFRLIDLVRLDLTTFVGLTAFLYNYHFDDFFSSPSAFTLDVIAITALLVFVTRAALGYKQTWDRYQLLVNKTLYEKTLANGFGVVHFLLDASEEQQLKEAILVFVVLSHQYKVDGMSKEQLANACERFLYYRCKEQTQMPVDNAINTLLELGLISIIKSTASSAQRGTEVRFKALNYDEGLAALGKYWESIPSKSTTLR
ncbi:hypothetical protein MPTK1_8g12690 [Marchantia polymorpha subsp. ruderalis]|uniref:Uncharacterized protein n=1 Tax=Marchantia polymorpha TaxID=3197 RepID=A0A2R6WJP7_MARPO|nr:hypothetical protein MARPO_0083s0051 [Marchantia polymorpha]BBN19679.1 hypothetical protein Mp_8g12690 [Marchantia polymorpha subsp. ruderalis]|eukprot:PTQ34088.1 hypothetical protein MARPO_0083s0051 [Marchantia polymorpha]